MSQTTAKALTLGLSTVTTILVARWLGPRNYGLLSIVFVFAAFWGLTADPGATLAVLHLAHGDKAARVRLTRLSVGLSIIYGPVVCMLMLIVGWAIYGRGQSLTVVVGIAIVLPSLLGAIVSSSLTPLFMADIRLQLLAWLETAATTAILIGTTCVLVFHAGVLSLVAVSSAVGAAQATASYIVAGRIFGSLRPIFRSQETNTLIATATPLFLNVLIIAIYGRLDAFLLSILASPATLGIYSLGYRVIQALSVIPNIITGSTYSHLSGMRDQIPEFRLRSTDVWEIATALGFGCTVVGIPWSPLIVAVLGGNKFVESVDPLRVLFAGLGFSLVAAITGYVVVACGERALLLKVSIDNLALNAAMNIVLIPRFGATGAAVAFCCSELLGAIWGSCYLAVAGRLQIHRSFVLKLTLISLGCLAAGFVTSYVNQYVFIGTMTVAAVGALAVLKRDVFVMALRRLSVLFRLWTHALRCLSQA